MLPQPVAPGQKRGKRRRALQQQRQRAAESARVGHQVPVAGQAHKTLYLVPAEHRGLLNGIGRLGVVDHAPGLGVAGDRRAAQALEQAELDLMRAQRVQGVKTLGKTGQGLAGQAKDQVGVQVGLGLSHQPVQVSQGFGVVLAARDALLHLGIETLDANFELQHARWKLRDQGLEPVWQLVRDQLKVHKQVRGQCGGRCGD